jgi:hypothetical protein
MIGVYSYIQNRWKGVEDKINSKGKFVKKVSECFKRIKTTSTIYSEGKYACI